MDFKSPRGAMSTKPLLSTAIPGSDNLGLPVKKFALFALALGIGFCAPLATLVRYSVSSELYSHVLLMPFVSFYLVWLNRRQLPRISGRSPGLAAVPFLVGLALLGCYGFMRWRGWQHGRDDYLFLTIGSFLFFLIAGGCFFFGRAHIRAVSFPLAMLFFMVPFPSVVLHGIESFLQRTSADATSVFLSLSGTPVFREGLIFHLPGISLQVAEECSGIRSSLVLFITGLLAAYLFLRTPWKRAVLALVVIPLAIVRNGFRIFTIGMLCVHIDPSMIHSPLHRRGGPVFFLLSLIPFFVILVLLRKSERAGAPPTDAPH